MDIGPRPKRNANEQTEEMAEEARLREAFALFDTDGSGSLSVEELRTVLSRPGSTLSDEEIQALIDEFDEDGDGEMQFEEFVKLWTPATTEESAGKREALALSSKSRKPSFLSMSFTKKGSGVDDTSAGGTLEDASGGSFLLASASKSFKKRLSLGGDASEGKSFSMGKSFRKSFVQGISVLSAAGEKRLQTSEELHREAVEAKSKADHLRALAPTTALGEASFEARWGMKLASLGLPFQELVKRWDTNDDRTLTKIEFRQAVRQSGVVANNADIDRLFKDFDADNSGTLEISELKPCVIALQEAAIAAQAQSKAELKRADICDEKAAMLFAAEQSMLAVEQEERDNLQIELEYPIDVRIGMAIVKSKKKLDVLIKKWPGAQVGYASREALGEGLRQLNVLENATHEEELDDWYRQCFRNGLAASVCRQGGGMSLKVDLPKTVALAKQEHKLAQERDAALRERKKKAFAEQERIRARDRAVAKEWARRGADALRAVVEKAQADKAAQEAKRLSQEHRKKAEKKRVQEQIRARADQAEKKKTGAAATDSGSQDSGRRTGDAIVYNAKLKSTDLGLRTKPAPRAAASEQQQQVILTDRGEDVSQRTTTPSATR